MKALRWLGWTVVWLMFGVMVVTAGFAAAVWTTGRIW